MFKRIDNLPLAVRSFIITLVIMVVLTVAISVLMVIAALVMDFFGPLGVAAVVGFMCVWTMVAGTLAEEESDRSEI